MTIRQAQAARLEWRVQRIGPEWTGYAVRFVHSPRALAGSLVSYAGAGFYLYDGRAATMKDVLTTHNPDDIHGVTSNLTDNEIKDLAEFILSL